MFDYRSVGRQVFSGIFSPAPFVDFATLPPAVFKESPGKRSWQVGQIPG